jgi:membrane-associated phospholipid phosphatase
MTRAPRLSRREQTIVWVSFVVVAFLAADVVVGGPFTHLDRQVRDAIQPRGDTVAWWLSAVSALGDLRVAIPLVLAAALVASQVAWRMWPALFLIGTFAAVELCVLALKAVVARPGPGASAVRDGYPGYFPSGHAATSCVLVATVLFVARRLGWIRLPQGAEVEASLAAGALVGALAGLRAVLGDSHWMSDVVAGVLLCAAIVVPAMALCRQLLDGAFGGSPATRTRRAAGHDDDASAP